MRSERPWFPKNWHKGDILALAFLLLGMLIILSLVLTDLEYATWTLWIAVPMVMFSLAYLFLVSALPIFLGPRSGSDPEDDQPSDKDRE